MKLEALADDRRAAAAYLRERVLPFMAHEGDRRILATAIGDLEQGFHATLLERERREGATP